MDKGGVHKLFMKAGLARLTGDIDVLLKPSIRLRATPVDEARLPLGASKLGGLPDLPPDVTWPIWNSLPQSFIAQIRLRDVHRYDTDGVLPALGMLWFFYDAHQETYGDQPADRGGWSVLFNEEPAPLTRVSAPAQLPSSGLFKSAQVRFSGELTLAQIPDLEITNYDWTDEEQQKYEDLLANFTPQSKRAFRHRLLGNPDIIQDDLRMQCQLVSHDVTSDDDPRKKTLEPGAKDWRLLLQIDTDERIGMRWASSGMLYYSITTSDLQAQHFDNTWLILQSD